MRSFVEPRFKIAAASNRTSFTDILTRLNGPHRGRFSRDSSFFEPAGTNTFYTSAKHHELCKPCAADGFGVVLVSGKTGR
jgi:hypothetical protein